MRLLHIIPMRQDVLVMLVQSINHALMMLHRMLMHVLVMLVDLVGNTGRLLLMLLVQINSVTKCSHPHFMLLIGRLHRHVASCVGLMDDHLARHAKAGNLILGLLGLYFELSILSH